MLSLFPNQILVERYGFAFIIDIEFEKLPPFFSSCKIIRYNISKYRRHLDNLNNMTKLPTVLSKLIVVQYKPVLSIPQKLMRKRLVSQRNIIVR